MSNGDMMRVSWPMDGDYCALPPLGTTRLAIASRSPGQRWMDSGFLPASRFSARLVRAGMRGFASVAGMRAGCARSDAALREAFEQLASGVPAFDRVAVRTGTAGPGQKLLICFVGEDGNAIAFGKLACTESARRLVHREIAVLSGIAPERGPSVLSSTESGRWCGLAVAALPGTPLKAHAACPRDLEECLPTVRSAEPGVHPWLNAFSEGGAAEFAEILSRRSWPVVVSHGDAAPWNMVRGHDGLLRLFDWEYANVEGFPHVDRAQYVLRTSQLIRRMAPAAALTAARQALGSAALEAPCALAIIGLAAAEGAGRAEREHPASARWWSAVAEHAAYSLSGEVGR